LQRLTPFAMQISNNASCSTDEIMSVKAADQNLIFQVRTNSSSAFHIGFFALDINESFFFF
jgi:hypothetical protein